MKRKRTVALLLAGALFAVLTAFTAATSGENAEEARAMQGDLHPHVFLDRSSPDGARYVGGEACRSCHEAEFTLWENSHHDLAMRPATPDNVLGDFDDTRFVHHDVETTFSRRDGRYFVRTEGPDGEMADYEIAYTFGWEPLQQYLIAFPGGRLQTLPVSWDSRPASEGGQRWFHIYGAERIAPGDALYWTGPNQNWNFMCAECHSTNLRKNYDPVHRVYRTSWSEINVSCEACHGPGSGHLDWAAREAEEAGSGGPDKGLFVTLRDTDGGRWAYTPGAKVLQRSAPLASRVQAETCARCHARRSTLTDDYVHGRSFHDTHRLEPLSEGMYEVDGQIRDEVYVYGSFIQSRMHAAGVRCVDCHEPHSLKLRATGNALCVRCHVEGYDTVDHHFHPQADAGQRCVDCHMAERTYMQVDDRRDHSFRVPRPDLSVRLGTPNACNDCHGDRDFAWAAAQVEAWYGPDRADNPHFAEALAAARAGQPEAVELLRAFLSDRETPALVKATLLEEWGPSLRREDLPLWQELLRDPEPLVRAAAVEVLEVFPPEARVAFGVDLLDDPVRSVRLAAVAVLAPAAGAIEDPDLRRRFEDALRELEAVHAYQSDRASGWSERALLQADLGELEAAIRSSEEAVAMEPWFVPARVNLADFLRRRGRPVEAHGVLAEGVARDPEAPVLQYAFGLSSIRQGKLEAALEALREARDLAPEEPQYAYAYALALLKKEEAAEAVTVLREVLAYAPHHRSVLVTLATLHRDRGDYREALAYARQLSEAWPDDPQAAALRRELEERLRRPAASPTP